jgi:hypothetical protein
VFSQNIGYCDVLRNKTTGE